MSSEGITCQHCGQFHKTTCPRIKALEYFPDGTVRRVEFYDPKSADAVAGGPATAAAKPKS